MVLNETVGYLAALGSAAAWAYSSILFRKLGDDVSPAGMNLSSSAIGLVYMALALPFTGFVMVDAKTFFILGLSGLFGLTLGGILFFRALMCLGPRLMMLTGLSVPPATILLAVLLLHERPSPAAWAGSALVFAGIAFVLWKKPETVSPENLRKGLFYAALSALVTAVSIILAKVGVAEVSALEASMIRHFWSVVILTTFGCATGSIKSWLKPFADKRLLKFVVSATFVVIFGGFWLSMVGLKYAYASTATILNMTEPLFILPFTALLLKEKVTTREIVGAVVAFAGVVVIFMK